MVLSRQVKTHCTKDTTRAKQETKMAHLEKLLACLEMVLASTLILFASLLTSTASLLTLTASRCNKRICSCFCRPASAAALVACSSSRRLISSVTRACKCVFNLSKVKPPCVFTKPSRTCRHSNNCGNRNLSILPSRAALSISCQVIIIWEGRQPGEVVGSCLWGNSRGWGLDHYPQASALWLCAQTRNRHAVSAALVQSPYTKPTGYKAEPLKEPTLSNRQ